MFGHPMAMTAPEAKRCACRLPSPARTSHTTSVMAPNCHTLGVQLIDVTTSLDHSRCIVNRPPDLRADQWTGFLHELASALEEVLRHGRAFVVVSVPESDAFVQFGVTANGTVAAEASGSALRRTCCAGRHHLTEHQTSALRSLGWRAAPDTDDGSPLWSRPLDDGWHSPAALYSELFVRTLAEVFAVPGTQALTWVFGNMPREGGVSRAA